MTKNVTPKKAGRPKGSKTTKNRPTLIAGRPKGSKNRQTDQLVKQLVNQNFDVVKEFVSAIHGIDDPRAKAKYLLDLMKFIYPMRTPQEGPAPDSDRDHILDVQSSVISEAETDDLINALKKK